MHFKSDDRAPLLIVGAEKDNTVPASLAKKQYEKYEKSAARTDYVEFPGRPHLMMVGDGWEEIAGRIESWVNGVPTGSAVSSQSTTRNPKRHESAASSSRYWRSSRPIARSEPATGIARSAPRMPAS